MDIIVADMDGTDGRRTADLLRSRQHTVRLVMDARSLVTQVSQQAPDALVLDVSFLAGKLAVSLPSLRAVNPDRYLYVVAVAARYEGVQVEGLYRAGVDDLLRRGSSREEVIGRAEAPARIRTWASRIAAAACDFGASFDLDRLKAWRDIEALAAGEFGELMSTALATSATPSIAAVTHAAEIAISFPAEKLEVRLAVGVDEAAARDLSEHLFGGLVGHDVLSDALREMANTLAGAFKRMALAEGALFTIGLPVSRSPFRLGTAGTRSFELESPTGLRLGVMALQVAQDPKRVFARDLREGMVLVQDVKNGAGLTLLTAGTSLTDRTVERLITLVGPMTLLEVGEPGTIGRPDAARRLVVA